MMIQKLAKDWVLILCCMIIATAATSAEGQDPSLRANQKKVKVGEVLRIVERITNLDEGSQEIITLNSRVVVKTPTIKEIVAMGPRIIPVIIEVMKCEEISFDTFTRCYSACDQILRQKDPKIKSIRSRADLV
jgi:hypothetical protein